MHLTTQQAVVLVACKTLYYLRVVYKWHVRYLLCNETDQRTAPLLFRQHSVLYHSRV